MSIPGKGLVATWFAAASGILGGLGGLIVKVTSNPECMDVSVPKIDHNVTVDVDASKVDLSASLKTKECVDTLLGTINCYFIDQKEAQDQVNNLEVNVDAGTPKFKIDTSVEGCTDYIYYGAALGAAVGLVGAGLYYWLEYTCSRKNRLQDPELGDGTELESFSETMSTPSSMSSSYSSSHRRSTSLG